MGPCKKKLEAPRKQSKPKEKLRAAYCQQGIPAVATAVALFYGVCRGFRPCYFIDPGFCMGHRPFVTLCAILWCMQGGQHLLFYRPWLLLTRICYPQDPHVSPPVLFYRSCRESDPSFCQSRHALKQSMWLVWLHNSFMFI